MFAGRFKVGGLAFLQQQAPLQQQQQQITIKIMMKTMPPITPPIMAPTRLDAELLAALKLFKALAAEVE